MATCPVSCELIHCINMAFKAREDKEVLCSPPTVPAFGNLDLEQ